MFCSTLAVALLLAAGPGRTPPPIYDFCALAVPAGEAVHEVHLGTNCDGENLVVDHDCGTWSQTYAPEDYYALTLEPGCGFTAVVAHEGDAMLMVTAECIVYGTMFTCLAAADAAPAGGVETLTYLNADPAARTVYLVIDSRLTAGCGAYALDLYADCPVGTARVGWGTFKSTYR